MKKKTHTVLKVDDVGCVTALEFEHARLSACLAFDMCDVRRVLEAIKASLPEKHAPAFDAVDKLLKPGMPSVVFTSPISSSGRVKLVTELEQVE
jgi:hypothetical protein